MVLKLYMDYIPDSRQLCLRVLFLDKRFRYTEGSGIVRQFKSKQTGITIYGTAHTSFDKSTASLYLGYADEEICVINDVDDIRDVIDISLIDWKKRCIHLKDIYSQDEETIYEY